MSLTMKYKIHMPVFVINQPVDLRAKIIFIQNMLYANIKTKGNRIIISERRILQVLFFSREYFYLLNFKI